MNYTEGVWTKRGLFIKTEERGYIAEVLGLADPYEEEANAQLIASAPDLYEALKEAQDFIEWVGNAFSNKDALRNKIKKALAKAEGK